VLVLTDGRRRREGRSKQAKALTMKLFLVSVINCPDIREHHSSHILWLHTHTICTMLHRILHYLEENIRTQINIITIQNTQAKNNKEFTTVGIEHLSREGNPSRK